MTQNPNEQKQNVGAQKKTCEVCHQTFNSDRELQDHMQNAHSQRKQSGGQTGDRPGQDQQKQEKIA
jgi:hypothetical protein